MNYIQVSDDVAQDHFRDAQEKVVPLTSSDVWKWYEGYSAQAQASGYYQVDERIVEGVWMKDTLTALAQQFASSDRGEIDSFDFYPWTPRGQFQSSVLMMPDKIARFLGADGADGEGSNDGGSARVVSPAPGGWSSNLDWAPAGHGPLDVFKPDTDKGEEPQPQPAAPPDPNVPVVRPMPPQ